jgi:hypothetical protein
VTTESGVRDASGARLDVNPLASHGDNRGDIIGGPDPSRAVSAI